MGSTHSPFVLQMQSLTTWTIFFNSDPLTIIYIVIVISIISMIIYIVIVISLILILTALGAVYSRYY